MSNETKKTALPKLRFPEFEDAPEWQIFPLGKLIDGVSKKNRDKKIDRVFTNSAVNGIVDQRDFFDKDIATKGNTDNYSVVELGDYVYNPRISETAPVGPTSRNKLGEGIVSPLYTVFRFQNPDNGFYEHYFKSSHWQKSLKAIGNSGARHDRMGISLSQLRKVEVPVLGPEEQQKIATILSSLDDVIIAQRAKLAALQVHRQGLMQELFPAEGETLPKLRFEGFDNEWKPWKLADFITERIEYPTEKVPLYSLTIEDGVTPKTERYERAFLVNDEEAAYKLVKPNDFAYNPMNLRFGAIARHSGDITVSLSKYYNIFYCNETVDSRFCEYYFRSQQMINYYDTVATGSLIEKRRVHYSSFIQFKINFPDFAEQQKIADAISSLDDLITAQIQQIETLKLHKKGLLQDLFPTAEPTI